MTSELTTRERTQFRLGGLWADERVADFPREVACATGARKRRKGALHVSRADMADHLGVMIQPSAKRWPIVKSTISFA